MKKVKAKSETYAIYLGKSDGIDEKRFADNIADGDETKCEVIVLFKDDFNNLINERDSLKKQVQDLTSSINEKDSQIKSLNEKLEEDKRFYIDEIRKSSEDYSENIKEVIEKHQEKMSAITSEQSDHQKEISDLEIKHQKEKSEILMKHQDEMNDLKIKYNNTLVKLRTEDHTEILDNNKKLNRIREDLKDLGFFEKHSKTYKNLLTEFDETLDEIEKTRKNKLSNVDESFAELPMNEVNEDSEKNN